MDKYYDEQTAAQVMGCSPALLRKWRQLGQGPIYHKIGRLVRYADSDIHAYMEAHRVEAGGTQ